MAEPSVWHDPAVTDRWSEHLDTAVALALEAEARGWLPVGAVVVHEGRVVGAGCSQVPGPPYRPGRHAEIVALAQVPDILWPVAHELTVVSTLEPCLMCFGTCLLHGIGRIVFGARDVRGGASHVFGSLPPYYDGGGVPEWIGPLDPGRCDPLYARCDVAFARLPAGRVNTP
jgi:tRNA(adenine34) deaminase